MCGTTTEACTTVAANKENPVISEGHGLWAASMGKVSLTGAGIYQADKTTQNAFIEEFIRTYWTEI